MLLEIKSHSISRTLAIEKRGSLIHITLGTENEVFLYPLSLSYFWDKKVEVRCKPSSLRLPSYFLLQKFIVSLAPKEKKRKKEEEEEEEVVVI